MRAATFLRDPVPAAFAVRLAKAFGITFLALPRGEGAEREVSRLEAVSPYFPSLHAYVLLLGVGLLLWPGGGR